ncbi:MAG TPA: hypothetical protein GXX21_00045 [Syntrophomonadaceae bacterium]|nr:hypothetical protein [Syntrophomonadaceae bacterium]
MSEVDPLILYTVQHVLVLRLLICYKFQSVELLHNLLFLVSAAKDEEQDIAFYDFVRTRNGAYSRTLQKIIDEFIEEKLVVEKEGLLEITEKGRHVYTNLGASLRSFSALWDLCVDIMERYQGDAQKIKEGVFHHITFRRAKKGEHIFDYGWY